MSVYIYLYIYRGYIKMAEKFNSKDFYEREVK